MHYERSELPAEDIGNGRQRRTITLGAGDSAGNPASTSRPIYGPALVTYEESRSGITTYVNDAPEVQA